MRVQRTPSLRGLLAALLAVVLLLAAALSTLTALQIGVATKRTRAERQRVTSFRLADQMRQSSNDLTRMVRLYVTTGDPRYRRYYDQILDIRAGRAPRPRRYDSSFWDRVLADGEARIRLGPPASLTTLMRRAHFAPAEFAALRASLRASDELAELELRVMARVGRHLAAGTYGAARRASAYRRMVDDHYHQEKGRIMAAIDRFTALVDARTARRAASLQARTDRLLVAQTAALVLLLGMLLGTLAVASRALVRPLLRLADVTRRITRGDWSPRARPQGVRELTQLAGAFNEMADTVERDLAARRRAEREAQAADRAKSAFLAMMSHELRTPLVAVTGTLEILALDDLDAHQRELVDVAMGSARALLDVIGDVLDFSKIEAGALDLSPAPVAIGPLVAALAEQHRPAASARELSLDVVVDPRLGPAHVADAARLRQVLGNLVGNALKFTREGGVVVSVEVAGGDDAGQELRLTVRDTGIGISPDDQARLFLPFAQASTQHARSSEGTGLGLAICRQLVEAMGGSIGLRSTPGVGTELQIALRLERADPSAAAAAGSETPDGGRGPRLQRAASREAARDAGALLLLVEDNPVNRRVLRGQLEAVGFHVDTAADADEAVRRFTREPYALVFTDIQLPHVDGYALAGLLRAHEEARGRPRTPILALTASALQGELVRCRAAGMDDVVTKPATIATLAATLRARLPGLAWSDEVVAPAAPSALAELTGGDERLAAQILAEYAATLEADLEALAEALRVGDRPAVRRRAHQIAGASRTVGAWAVAEGAERLERTAPDGTPDALGALVVALRGQIASSRPASSALSADVAPEETTEPASSSR